MPESFILFHLSTDFFFLSIADFITQILLQKRIQTNLVLIAAISKTLSHCTDNSMGDLCIEDTITANAMLID